LSADSLCEYLTFEGAKGAVSGAVGAYGSSGSTWGIPQKHVWDFQYAGSRIDQTVPPDELDRFRNPLQEFFRGICAGVVQSIGSLQTGRAIDEVLTYCTSNDERLTELLRTPIDAAWNTRLPSDEACEYFLVLGPTLTTGDGEVVTLSATDTFTAQTYYSAKNVDIWLSTGVELNGSFAPIHSLAFSVLEQFNVIVDVPIAVESLDEIATQRSLQPQDDYLIVVKAEAVRGGGERELIAYNHVSASIVRSRTPVGQIVSVSPSSANQSERIIISFVGAGSDLDNLGVPPSIRWFRWTSDLGKVSGDTVVCFDDEPTCTVAAAAMAVGSHRISFQVQDNDGEWSDPVQGRLTILPGSPEGHVVAYSPSQANPITAPPATYFCADMSWDLRNVPGFDPSVGFSVEFGVETSTGGWCSNQFPSLHEASASHRQFCGLATCATSLDGTRDFRVQVRNAGTNALLVQVVEPDAIRIDNVGPADFQLSVVPDSRSIGSQGGSVVFDVTGIFDEGFVAPVVLSVGPTLPPGATFNFSRNPINLATPQSTLTVSVRPRTAGGNYHFSITGSGNGLTHAASPKPIIEVSGEPLRITFLDTHQDPTAPCVVAIHFRLDGTPGSYYPIRWQVLRPGYPDFCDIGNEVFLADRIPPVPCPGDYWAHWNMCQSACNLQGMDDAAYIRMQISSTPAGMPHGIQIRSNLPYRIPGLTWDGASLFYAATEDSSGNRLIRKFTASFGDAGSCGSLPASTDTIMYYANQVWIASPFASDRFYPMTTGCVIAPCRTGATPPYLGPSVGGMMWTNIDNGYGALPFLIEGSTLSMMAGFDCVASRPGFFHFTTPQRWTIRGPSASGITFDGRLLWVTESSNLRLYALNWYDTYQGTWLPAQDLDFDTQDFTGPLSGTRGVNDVAFANDYLWIPVPTPPGNGTNVWRVTTPVLSQRTQGGFPFDLNDPPQCGSLAADGGSGDVPIHYQLDDEELDSLSILLEYSTDGGATWATCAVVGQTVGIGPGGYSGSLTLLSETNLPDYCGQVVARLTPRDRDTGIGCETEFLLCNFPPPQNHAPEAPQNLYPVGGQTRVSRTPTLVGSSFSDSDPTDQQEAVEFQLRADAGGYDPPLWESGTLPVVSFVTIPESAGLACGERYWWRGRYQDNSEDMNSWSAWSAESVFTTAAIDEGSASWDCDRDVALDDYTHFVGCFAGPPTPPENDECIQAFDLKGQCRF
jgi:hypothetical protein